MMKHLLLVILFTGCLANHLPEREIASVNSPDCAALFSYFAPNKFYHLANSLEDISFYRNYSRILFLSDGQQEVWESLAEQVAQYYPEKSVVKTDVSIVGEHMTLPNLKSMFLDNSKPMPFDDNSFDLVVMKRGICLCHSPNCTCGGIIMTQESTQAFLSEVSRILDKNSANSLAFLHGDYGQTRETLNMWVKAGQFVMEKERVVIKRIHSFSLGGRAIIRSDGRGIFRGVGIAPR